MTFKQLECFLVVAQKLNFTQAAADLFMAQPALSRTISGLEDEMGVQLFERNSRTVALTPAGASFLQDCPRILELYHDGLNSARLAQQGLRGSLLIGFLRDAFEPCLAQIYRQFTALCPDVSLNLRCYSQAGLLTALAQGEADAVLSYEQPAGWEGRAGSILLRRNRQCVITAPNHPLANRGSLRMEELRDEPFLIMARNVSDLGHDYVWEAAAQAGFSPTVAGEANHIAGLLNVVACGLGISILTDDMEHLAQGMVSFIPLEGAPFSSLRFLWDTHNHNPALPRLLEEVRAIAGETPQAQTAP